ncbi:MAG: WG repeat-containing protein, partial [Flavobacteriia bacterium]|nr:WG repeat-containing protein [Flavobacteriia bacterium]
MRLLSYIFPFIIVFQSFSQLLESPLPIVKNGRWYLFDGQKEIPLPQTYSYVNIFDSKGTALFTEGNNHGIIDETGKEISKSVFIDLEQIGNGIYKQSTLEGYKIFTSDAQFEIICKWSKKINENWIIYKQDSLLFLLNTAWNKGIKISHEEQIKLNSFNHILFQADYSNILLYNAEGQLIDSTSSLKSLKKNETYFYYKSQNINLYCDIYGKMNFSKDIDNVTIFENTIKFNQGNKTKIISKKERKTIIEFDCNDIEIEGENFKIFTNGFCGLINSKGEVLIPPKYDYYLKHLNGYFIFRNQLKGFLNSKFEEKIPCNFKEIYFDNDFIKTTTYLGGLGLIHASTFKEILPAYYFKIEINDLLIKAYANDKMTLIQLHENKTIKSKVIIDHVISIRSNEQKSTIDFDQRLLTIGWYFDTLSIYTKNNKWESTGLKWGIKNNRDSILLKASLKTPVFIPNAPISLIKSTVSEFYYLNQFLEYPPLNTFVIYNYNTAKKVNTPPIFDFDSTDFTYYNFARFLTQSGPGIYFKDHHYKLVNYIEHDDNEFIRYCVAEEIEKSKDNNLEDININKVYFNSKIEIDFIP